MFDIVYITWFVHVTTSLVSRYLWWFYAVVCGNSGFVLTLDPGIYRLLTLRQGAASLCVPARRASVCRPHVIRCAVCD